MTNEEAINVLRGQESAYWHTLSEAEHKAFDLAVDALTAQQPRVLTLEEVMKHYSLPPVFVDDLGMQEDYLQDIQPLYFEINPDRPWNAHWLNYDHVDNIRAGIKDAYGTVVRAWSARPTKEQREATPWGELLEEGDSK